MFSLGLRNSFPQLPGAHSLVIFQGTDFRRTELPRPGYDSFPGAQYGSSGRSVSATIWPPYLNWSNSEGASTSKLCLDRQRCMLQLHCSSPFLLTNAFPLIPYTCQFIEKTQWTLGKSLRFHSPETLPIDRWSSGRYFRRCQYLQEYFWASTKLKLSTVIYFGDI